jgi:HD-GYP domain-containing protein (c-di-GMP phosphodiesterase class II)
MVGGFTPTILRFDVDYLQMPASPLEQLQQISSLLPPQIGGRVRTIARELEAERSALTAFQNLGMKLSGVRDSFDVITLFQDMLEEAVRLMQADRGALALVEENNTVRVVDSCSKDSHEEVQVSRTLLERVVQTKQAIITTNVQEDMGNSASESILALDIRSVLAVPLRSRDQVIGVLYVDTQFTLRAFTEADASILNGFAAQAGVAVTLARSIRQEHDNYVSLVKIMLSTLESRDEYTAGHSDRVGLYTSKLAQKIGWTGADLERAMFAGWVHDIGKIGVRDVYLNKTGVLTPEERKIFNEHTVIGERLLRNHTKGFDVILAAIRSHHEKWDGSGYPDGLVGEKIPLLARMVGISDAFDAMTTARSYSTPKSWEQGFAILQKDAGTHFDPSLVPLFIQAMSDQKVTEAVLEINRSGELDKSIISQLLAQHSSK